MAHAIAHSVYGALMIAIEKAKLLERKDRIESSWQDREDLRGEEERLSGGGFGRVEKSTHSSRSSVDV